MLRIEMLNAADLAEKFDKLLEAMDELPIHAESELKAWQLSDMNRAQPIAYRPDAASVETVIWPRQYKTKHARSGFSKRRSVTPVRRRVGFPNYAQRQAIWRQQAMQRRRPIVRPELMDMLVDRMYGLRDRIVKWPRGKL